MNIIFSAVIVLGILGFTFAVLLALAAGYYRVKDDPLTAKIIKILPGTNCGACGSAGCHDFALKLARGEAGITGCVAGGEAVASQLAEAMGVEKQKDFCRLVADVHCGAKEDQRVKKSKYHGISTCAAANLIDGGGLACRYGCLGFGDCFSACPFDAIRMVDGLPVIDPNKCTACKKCIVVCPRNIVSLIPCAFRVIVACSSHDRGGDVRKICPVGCIGCGICEKEAPAVFRVENNLAEIDYTKANADCDPAVSKCPTKCIVKLN